MRKYITIFISLFFIYSCGSDSGGIPCEISCTTYEPAPASVTSSTPKYIFLFIGDGMGEEQVKAADEYKFQTTGSHLTFTTFPQKVKMSTSNIGSTVTDSASAATAMASGYKTSYGRLNINPAGNKCYRPITYALKENNYKIGIMTSVSLNHATPSGFYANVLSRSCTYEIGKQLPTSEFDYFSGGGFVKQNDLYKIFTNNSYTVATTETDLLAVPNGTKTIGVNEKLQDSMSMPYEIDRIYSASKYYNSMSLAEHLDKAIQSLGNGSDNFFIMLEGGKIDWAGHANDIGASIHDIIAFDDAVKKALTFYNSHQANTLIIVTADHETGGMTTSPTASFASAIGGQKVSHMYFNTELFSPYKDTHPIDISGLATDINTLFNVNTSGPHQTAINEAFKYSMKGTPSGLYGGYEPLTITLTEIIANDAGVTWSSYDHTPVNVPVYAIGKNAATKFATDFDNTDLYRKIVE